MQCCTWSCNIRRRLHIISTCRHPWWTMDLCLSTAMAAMVKEDENWAMQGTVFTILQMYPVHQFCFVSSTTTFCSPPIVFSLSSKPTPLRLRVVLSPELFIIYSPIKLTVSFHKKIVYLPISSFPCQFSPYPTKIILFLSPF
jgi:hypothetical protein